MSRLESARRAVLVALVLASLPGVMGTAGALDLEERKARILANLGPLMELPAGRQAAIEKLEPTEWPGLDQGILIVSEGGSEVGRLAFFVSSDLKKLYFFRHPEPVDVSRDPEQVAAETRAKAEAGAAKARARLEANLAGRPVRGSAAAPITIVGFGDFQCPYCSRAAETIEQVLAKHARDVKFVFQHFPLSFHPWARPAAIAAECAARQRADAFWTLHDRYYEHQREITPGNVLAKGREYLAGTGIDFAAWTACAEAEQSASHQAVARLIDEDMAVGQSLGVSGTPAFFINGRMISGAQPLAAFEEVIEAARGSR